MDTRNDKSKSTEKNGEIIYKRIFLRWREKRVINWELDQKIKWWRPLTVIHDARFINHLFDNTALKSKNWCAMCNEVKQSICFESRQQGTLNSGSFCKCSILSLKHCQILEKIRKFKQPRPLGFIDWFSAVDNFYLIFSWIGYCLLRCAVVENYC